MYSPLHRRLLYLIFLLPSCLLATDQENYEAKIRNLEKRVQALEHRLTALEKHNPRGESPRAPSEPAGATKEWDINDLRNACMGKSLGEIRDLLGPPSLATQATSLSVQCWYYLQLKVRDPDSGTKGGVMIGFDDTRVSQVDFMGAVNNQR